MPFKVNNPLLSHLAVLILLSAIRQTASTWEVSESQGEVSALKHYRNFNPGLELNQNDRLKKNLVSMLVRTFLERIQWRLDIIQFDIVINFLGHWRRWCSWCRCSKDIVFLESFRFGHIEKTAWLEIQGKFQNSWRHNLVTKQ